MKNAQNNVHSTVILITVIAMVFMVSGAHAPIMCFGQVQSGQGRGNAEVPEPAAPLGDPQTWILCIGINYATNPEWQTLPSCASDANSLANALKITNESNVTRLLDPTTDDTLPPTRKNIIEQIESICKNAKKNDQIIIAFFGHGLQDRNREPFLSPMDARRYPMDGKIEEVYATEDVKKAKAGKWNKATLISRDEIMNLLQASRAQRKILIVEACRNEAQLTLSDSEDDLDFLQALYTPIENESKGIWVLSSCAAGQRAYVDVDQKRTVFSRFLVYKINRADGELRMNELFEYVAKTVSWYAKEKLNPSQVQTPVLSGENTGDFVILTVKRVNGIPVTQLEAAEVHKQGRKFLDEKNYVKAFECFLESATQGYAPAQTNVGAFYVNGWGVEQSYHNAIKWYEEAADQNEPSAMCNLGDLYREGLGGLSRSFYSAVQWYERAAELEHAPGQWALGMRYYLGEGVPKDVDEAIKLFLKAANQDDTPAQSTLGAIYFQRADFKKAEQYLRPAAKKKDAQAMYFLGAGHLSNVYGTMGDANYEYGYILLVESMRQGNKDAAKMLELYKDSSSSSLLLRILRGDRPFFNHDL